MQVPLFQLARPRRARLLDLLGTAAKAPAWGGTDEVAHAAVFAVTRFAQLLQPEIRGAAADSAAAERVAVVVQRLLAVAGRGDSAASVSGAAA